jgi:hypothetical protein
MASSILLISKFVCLCCDAAAAASDMLMSFIYYSVSSHALTRSFFLSFFLSYLFYLSFASNKHQQGSANHDQRWQMAATDVDHQRRGRFEPIPIRPDVQGRPGRHWQPFTFDVSCCLR